MSVSYEYYCKKCDVVIERQFPFAKNPKRVKCECGKLAESHIGGNMTFILKGSGWPSKTNSLNKTMNQKQKRAGERMEGTWRHVVPKLVEQ